MRHQKQQEGSPQHRIDRIAHLDRSTGASQKNSSQTYKTSILALPASPVALVGKSLEKLVWMACNCIFLSRHGQSEYMLRELLGGNPPLTAQGRAYAQQLPELILPLLPQVRGDGWWWWWW